MFRRLLVSTRYLILLAVFGALAAVVLLGVTFLKQIVKWEGNVDLLGYGIATGLVIAALTYFISVKSKKSKSNSEESKE